MYCPRCAAQNLDDAKFCRGCGSNLETVALALSGQYQPAADSGEFPKDWLAVRHEGVQKLIRAIGLLGASLLIGTALGLFSNTNDWIIVWLIFVGWMAAWGVISLVSGIGSFAEAKFLKKRLEQSQEQYLGGRSKGFVTAELPLAQPGIPLSVTEHTTRALSQRESEK
ncbi:MAG TPA: zinc ribbon domain-containing protein [Pyrinomonadaceae bacterium]